MDMRNGKKTLNVNIKTDVNFHDVILPLILFGIGIPVLVITDDIFVSKVVVLVSLVLGLLLSVLGNNGILELFKISGWILVINVVPSFVFMIYTIFSVESKDPSKWSNYTPPSD